MRIVKLVLVVLVIASLFACSDGGGDGSGGGAGGSATGNAASGNFFQVSATGTGDIRNYVIRNLDDVFADKWPQVSEVAMLEVVGVAVINKVVAPNGTSVTFQIVGSGQFSYKLVGYDANGDEVYPWHGNPAMDGWFHRLNGIIHVGAVINNAGLFQLPNGVFTLPSVFRVQDGTAYMASWALACDRSVDDIQVVSVDYWDNSGGPWSVNFNRFHLEDEWIEIIPRLEQGDTELAVEAELADGLSVRARVWYLRQLGSTDVHSSEDRFLLAYDGQDPPPAGGDSGDPNVRIQGPESDVYSNVFTESEVLISVNLENAYTPTFTLNGDEVTDQFGELVEDSGLWAANLSLANEGAYTLTVNYFDNDGNEGSADYSFQYRVPTRNLQITTADMRQNLQGGAGSINLSSGEVVVNGTSDVAWYVQLRRELPDGFIEPGYFYRVQGVFDSRSDADGSPLAPRFMVREEATYTPFDDRNVACDGYISFDFRPELNPGEGLDGNGASLVLQFGSAGVGTYQLPANFDIKKVAIQ